MLKSNVSLETNKLAEIFGVSPVTIRRDFEYYENQGLLTTIYGGAMVNHTLPDKEEDGSSIIEQANEKKMIAKAAAEMVHCGDTILLDAGSTVKELAIELLGKSGITILTHSILAINVLAQGDKNISLTSMPGEFKKSSMCFYNAATMDFLENVHVDYAFLGCTAVSLARGCTIPEFEETYVKRKMAQCATKTVLLADHHKIGKESLFTVVPLSMIDLVITGKGGGPQLQKFRDAGTNVVEVEYKGWDSVTLPGVKDTQ